KPTQHSVHALRAIGIQPDAIICRSEKEIDGDLKEKIALFCDVPREAVVSVPDVDSIYEVPLMLEASGLGKVMARHFELDETTHAPDNGPWIELVDGIKHPRASVPIALVGKYVALPDAYLSVIESLKHAGIHPRLAGAQGLRRGGRVRAPPPPLRVQQRVPRGAGRRGHGVQRRVAERPPGGDHRAGRPPVVRGEPVPPRVPLAPEPRAPGAHDA